MAQISQAFHGVARLTGMENQSSGDKDFGFMRDQTMYEVYEDLLARVAMHERYFCPRIHGKRLVLTPSSCYVFRKDLTGFAEIRHAAIWITEWMWFERIVVSAIAMNSFVLAMPAAYNPEDTAQGSKDFVAACNLFTMVLFTVECFLKIIARGFFFSDGAPDAAYLRDPLNWLDFTVVIASLLELTLMAGSESNQVFKLVRTFRVLRPLRSIKQLYHLRLIITSLHESGHLLGHWVIIQGFFFTTLAILGNNLFSTAAWQQCRLTEQPIMVNGTFAWPVDPAQTRLCGGRYECQPQANGLPTYCGSPVSKTDGVLYDYDVWSEVDDNPAVQYGLNGFHTFQSSILTIFQVSTMDGWTNLLYRYQDAGGTFMAVGLFTVIVLLGGFLLMNLVVAILWERLTATMHRERLKTAKYKEERHYIVDEDIKGMTLIQLVKSVTQLDVAADHAKGFLAVMEEDDGDAPKSGPPKGAGRSICYTICKNPMFGNFFLLLIVVNCVILGMDSYPAFNQEVSDTFEEMSVFFTALFTVEVVIKMAGMGVDFVADQMNLFDFLIVTISLMEYTTSGEASMGALRTARLLRIFRMLSKDVPVKVLMRVLFKAVVPIYNFLVLVFLVCYCMALLGLQLFFVRDNKASGLGFHDLTWGFITVLTVLIGNDWFENMVKFTQIADDQVGIVIFFLLAFLVCNLILKNLFLGIFVAVFTQAREELLYEYRKRLMIHRHGEPPKAEVEVDEGPPSLEEEPEEVVDSPRFDEGVLSRKLLFKWVSHMDDGYLYSKDSPMPEAMETASMLVPECHQRPEILDQYITNKSQASEMNILRMMRVKQDASGRRRALGEALNFKQEEDGWRLPEVHDPEVLQSEAAEQQPVEEVEARFVSFNDKPTVMTGKGMKGQSMVSDRQPMPSPALKGPNGYAQSGNGSGQPGANGRGTQEGAVPNGYSSQQTTLMEQEERFHMTDMKGHFGSMQSVDFAKADKQNQGAMLIVGPNPNNSSMESTYFVPQDAAAAERGGKVLQSDVKLGSAPPPLVPESSQAGPLSGHVAPAPAARYRSAWSRAAQSVPPLRLGLDLDLAEAGRVASEGSGPEQPWTAADLSSRDPSAGLWMSSSSEGYFSDGFSSGLRQRRSLPALLPPKASFRELVHQAKAKLDAEAVEQAQARAEAAPLAVLALAPAREAGREAPRSRCDPHPCWELGLDVEAPERGTSRCQPEGLFAALDARFTSEEPPIDAKGRNVVAMVEEDLEEGEEKVDAATMRRRKLVEEDAGEVDYGFDEEVGSNGVRAIVESPAFDPFILCLIVIASVCLAMESPTMDKDSKLYLALWIVEKVTITFFIMEMGLKIQAYGALRGKPDLPPGSPGPYFRQGWNLIDFVVVLFGVIDVFTSAFISSDDSSFGVMRAFRVLRVLRPLRVVTKYKGIRNTVEAVIGAVPTMINLVMICMLFYFGWGILFVNLMKGALWHCSLDPTGTLRPDIENKKHCLEAGGEWVNKNFNFDHIGNSLATLLHASTGDGWVEVMLAVTNSQGIDKQPAANESFHLGMLVIVFVCVAQFFVMNLFIGVLVDHYMVAKDSINGEDNLTLEDKRWLDMQKNIFLTPKLLASRRHHLPGTRFLILRKWMQFLIESRSFEGLVVLAILGNTLLLMQAHPTDTKEARDFQRLMSLSFVAFFNLEAGLKIFIYQKNYFRKGWDYFDFVVVVGSNLSVIAHAAKLGVIAEVLLVFRVCRVLRLARWVSDLRVMVQTVWSIMPGLANVVALLCMIIFMYGCLGVSLFGAVADGQYVNHNANFHDFPSAVLLLLRVSTGERWDRLMYDLATQTPGCSHDFQTPKDVQQFGFRGCGTIISYPYFVSFVLVVGVVFMNLIVAVVLDGFSSVHQFEVLAVFRVQVADFVKAWRTRDYPWTGFLDIDTVVHDILMNLPPPVGFKGHRRKHVLHQMRFIRLHDGKLVHFKDVVHLCAQRSFIWMTHGHENETLDVQFDKKLLAAWDKQFAKPYIIDGHKAQAYPPEDPEGNDLFIAHIIIAAHTIRFLARKRKEWKLRKLEMKVQWEEQEKQRRLRQMTGESRSQGKFKIPGAGVGALDGEEIEIFDPEAPSMLLTQTEMQKPAEPIHLSPLPWPPTFAQPQVRQEKQRTKEQNNWSSALAMVKVDDDDDAPPVRAGSRVASRKVTMNAAEMIEEARRGPSKVQARSPSKESRAGSKLQAARPPALTIAS
mmetsp:Transcript_52829/g.115395  ORF Transcript_52829/g.115395 Transcript_52829/m.115395 type:complete len:2203 (-) Transcript_52829:222-6830(-)